MSQSRTICPICERAPGRRHSERCPRSTKQQRRLDASLQKAGKPRLFWQKGLVFVRAGGGKPVPVDNPGVPYVNPASGKPWYAGGLPQGEGMQERIQAYIEQLAHVIAEAKAKGITA